jgi:subtilisin family serine protease
MFAINRNSSLFFDRHGTHCAGVIAGAANNGICGVGVAYKVNIAGILLELIKYFPVYIYS